MVIPIVLIAFGVLMSLLNWGTVVASLRHKRFVSAVPLIGAIPLGCGLAMLPETRSFAWLAVFVDYGTFILIITLPRITYEVWGTSRINLLHAFTTKTKDRVIVIKLFRRHITVISVRFDPPVQCNEHGACAQSISLTGVWTSTESGFSVKGYGSNRELLIVKKDGAYATTELNYPNDKKYNYDCLDGLHLTAPPAPKPSPAF